MPPALAWAGVQHGVAAALAGPGQAELATSNIGGILRTMSMGVTGVRSRRLQPGTLLIISLSVLQGIGGALLPHTLLAQACQSSWAAEPGLLTTSTMCPRLRMALTATAAEPTAV